MGTCVNCSEACDLRSSCLCASCRALQEMRFVPTQRRLTKVEQRVCALPECDVQFEWRSDYPSKMCCSRAHAVAARFGTPAPEELLSAPRQRCPKCRQDLSQLEFHPNARGLKGRQCRRCQVARQRTWKAQNKAKVSANTYRARSRRLLKEYGAYTDSILRIEADQAGLCVYCDGPLGVGQIEHDHEQHAAGLPSFRGLACRSCNVTIGHMDDDPDRLRELAHRLDLLKRELRGSLGAGPDEQA